MAVLCYNDLQVKCDLPCSCLLVEQRIKRYDALSNI